MTDCPYPNALPIAIALSPVCNFEESPNVITAIFFKVEDFMFFVSTSTTAKSASLSVPRMVALALFPSTNPTDKDLASATTWLFVTIKILPSFLPMMIPEPTPSDSLLCVCPNQLWLVVSNFPVIDTIDGITFFDTPERSSLLVLELLLVVFVVASCVAPFPMPALLNPYVTPCITSPAINPKATADAANFATYFPLPLFLFFLGLERSLASSALH